MSIGPPKPPASAVATQNERGAINRPEKTTRRKPPPPPPPPPRITKKKKASRAKTAFTGATPKRTSRVNKRREATRARQLLTTEDLAWLLQIHRNRVYALIHEQGLPHLKFGSVYRFRWKTVQDWLAARERRVNT
jgi:excisionase family DNA binding protein